MQEGVAVLDLISDDALRWLVGEAEEFVAFNRDDLRAAVAAGRDDAWLGHDFLLSRCGHGSGFWDRGLGELGDRLHAAAKVFGDVVIEVFLGDDGWEALVS